MDIFVYADWLGIDGPILIGTLTVVHTRGHQVTSFDYSKDWIKRGIAQNLDPDLQFFSGPQYLGTGKVNFGIFTDYHLRNHGFLLTDKGWRLSPAYDVNPVYFGTSLALNISETDNSLDFDNAREVARYFRLNNTQSTKIIDEIKKVVKQWRKLANKYAIPSKEQDLMESAFELVQR